MSRGRNEKRKLKIDFLRGVRSLTADIKSAVSTRQLRRDGRLESLPKEARELCDSAFDGLNPRRLADYHVHVVGVGNSPSGAFIHPGSQSILDPRRYVRFLVFRRAYGLHGDTEPDTAFVSRLLDRAGCYPFPPRHGILAFDRFHRPDGTPDLSHTEFYVSNGYVFGLAASYPRLFAPILSVHPFRPDALQALERWHEAGGRIVKWLPNVMGIDPSDPSISPYYAKMRALGLTLLSHGGTEYAVDARDARQSLGNPQLLRTPLEHGVKVIVAHCAAAGRLPDLDHPGRKRTSCFSLFMRMMDEPRWQGLLFGEISGITLANRGREPLETILERPDIQRRLVNGSDYPLPAVRLAMYTRPLVRWGFLDSETRRKMDAIRAINPLLFDLVLKRTVRHPRTKKKLSAEIFHEHPALPLHAIPTEEVLAETAT